jgi:hypothetical protein
MKRAIKMIGTYVAWVFLFPVILVFPWLPFALMRWVDEKWPT